MTTFQLLKIEITIGIISSPKDHFLELICPAGVLRSPLPFDILLSGHWPVQVGLGGLVYEKGTMQIF